MGQGLQVRVAQHGDEHRGHAVEGGDVLVVDAGQGRLRAEIGQGQYRSAVGHGGGHGQHHAEAVEHGHLDHHAVGGGQVHAVADHLAVVDDVVVGQHHALGEAGGAGGVLHVAHVVHVHGGGHAADLLDGGAGGVLQRFLPGHGPGHPEAHGDHVAQEGQPAGVQRLAGFVACQLGAQLVHDLAVVGIPVALDHHQGVGVRLAQQVLRLMDLVGGVHRHQHRADLRGGPEGQKPLGHVGGPDGHLAAGPHAQGNQGAGELVHVVPKLAVGAGVVQRGEADGLLVGEVFHHRVQHLGEGLVDQGLLLPDVFAGVAVVPVQVLAVQPGALEAGHAAGEVGQQDLDVREAVDPVRVPLQGDEAVVVDRAQGVHQLAYGQAALAHQLGHVDIALPAEVVDVHMAHIGPQVGDGGLGVLAEDAGGVHVPQRRQPVVSKAVQQIAQPGGVGVDAGGFDQKRHGGVAHHGQQVRHALHAGGLTVAIGVHAYVGDAQVNRHLHALGKLCGEALVGEVAHAVHAGQRQAPVGQSPPCGGGQLGVGGAVLAGEGGAVHVEQLNARQLRVHGRGNGLGPGEGFPVL